MRKKAIWKKANQLIADYTKKISSPELIADPVVSVFFVTYNHAAFIEQALDSVLMQETDFPFEIVISEDASTDETPEIVDSYQQKHPDKIKILRSTRNLGHNTFGLTTLAIRLYRACRGKYIALLEGDDYWTDPLKLQKQVDFLEDHADYVLCCHSAKRIDHNNHVLKTRQIFQLTDDHQYSTEQLMQGSHLLTLTLMLRNMPILCNMPEENFEVYNGDTFLISMLGQYGKGKYLETIQPAAYRQHTGGAWSIVSGFHRAKHLYNTYDKLKSYYKKQRNHEMVTYFKKRKKTILIETLPMHHEAQSMRDYLRYYSYAYLLKNSPGVNIKHLKHLIKDFLGFSFLYFKNITRNHS